MKLKIIIGSTRPTRKGNKVAEWFYEIAKNNSDFEIEILDLQNINLPLMDEPNHPRFHQYTKDYTIAWSKMIEDGDAYIFVTPEYNFSYPATIKNAVDYLNNEWKYKPLSFVSYGGIAGGTRAVQAMKPVFTTLDMMPIYDSVNIPFFMEYFDDSGNFIGNDKFKKTAIETLNKLFIWSKHMKNLREEMNSNK